MSPRKNGFAPKTRILSQNNTYAGTGDNSSVSPRKRGLPLASGSQQSGFTDISPKKIKYNEGVHNHNHKVSVRYDEGIHAEANGDGATGTMSNSVKDIMKDIGIADLKAGSDIFPKESL